MSGLRRLPRHGDQRQQHQEYCGDRQRAEAQAKLHFHFNASMSALTLGKLEARQQGGGAQAGFSMASLKRRAFNQHLLERISRHLAHGHSLEKSSPDYQELCNYGTISEMAA